MAILIYRLAPAQRAGPATGVILISSGVALIGTGMVQIISGVIGLMLEDSQRSRNCSRARVAVRHRHPPICSLGRVASLFDRVGHRHHPVTLQRPELLRSRTSCVFCLVGGFTATRNSDSLPSLLRRTADLPPVRRAALCCSPAYSVAIPGMVRRLSP